EIWPLDRRPEPQSRRADVIQILAAHMIGECTDLPRPDLHSGFSASSGAHRFAGEIALALLGLEILEAGELRRVFDSTKINRYSRKAQNLAKRCLWLAMHHLIGLNEHGACKRLAGVPALIGREDLLDARARMTNELRQRATKGVAAVDSMHIGGNQQVARIAQQKNDLTSPPNQWISRHPVPCWQSMAQVRTIMRIGDARK